MKPILFYSLESLTLRENGWLNYHTTHKNDQNQLCTKNFATATYLTLRRDYGLHNRPTMQAIANIVKKFEETGVVTNIKWPVHHRLAENIAIVSDSVPKIRMGRFLVVLRN